MFNHSEKDFVAASEVLFRDVDASFDLKACVLDKEPRAENSKFVIGFAIAMPLSLLMWAAIIAVCYWVF